MIKSRISIISSILIAAVLIISMLSGCVHRLLQPPNTT